jgi:hypothetical protein
VIGVIEKVMVDCLLELGDAELVQDIFFAAGIPPDRVYRMDQHYPDAETAKLIDAALRLTGKTEQQLFDLFARVFFDVIELVFPEFLRMCETSEDLVRKQVKIHALIAAGSRKPGESAKSTDKFLLEDRGPHDILVRYKSELQICLLYETLVRHAAARFGDTVEITRKGCAHEGAEACIFAVKWTALGGKPTPLHPDLRAPEAGGLRFG